MLAFVVFFFFEALFDAEWVDRYKIMEMCRRPSAAETQKGATGDFADSCARIAAEFDLSKREGEVLALIARGNSSRWIADSLCISVSTVQTHSKNIYRKLGIHSKQELIEMVDAGKDDCLR